MQLAGVSQITSCNAQTVLGAGRKLWQQEGPAGLQRGECMCTFLFRALACLVTCGFVRSAVSSEQTRVWIAVMLTLGCCALANDDAAAAGDVISTDVGEHRQTNRKCRDGIKIMVYRL